MSHGDATWQKQGGAANRNHGEKGHCQEQEDVTQLYVLLWMYGCTTCRYNTIDKW